ncbi:alpha-N-acetylgalactosaminide alpha-2,6-sialyltransferase 5-like [Centruroides vittatus]|uniref:alpha-N-acetylgalactosaminide alpha-2,6-sialyltransferase 5-like n=1 Tax=Centruroides vittatus TaxID=120091 RepID=UPI00350FC252
MLTMDDASELVSVVIERSTVRSLKMQKFSRCKIFSAFLATILLIQVVLGLYALYQKDRIYRLPSDDLLEEKIQTNHLHPISLLNIMRRKELNEDIKPHFVARRGILGKNISGNKEFTDVNGEDVDLNFTCNTCAIVGTSGTLLNSHNGNSIDKNDCVFRIGLSPTSGFETNVGKKITARIISSRKLAELLKKPDKLVSGHLSVDRWIYYNLHDAENVSWILMKLREMKRKYKKMSFLRFSRRGEHRALSSLKKYGEKSGYVLTGAFPSTLWYTARVADLAKCSEINVYGIPDSKYCKRYMDNTVKEKYWDILSPQLCKNGVDFSSRTTDSEVLSITDRRSLKGWAKVHNISFTSPSWPQ